jgi:acyl dehydratase
MPSWRREVTADAVEHFALGLGDDNPLWWEAASAKSSAAGGRPAPPCYLYNHIRAPRVRPEQGMSSVEQFLPGVLGILAGETWRWRRRVRVGERIRAQGCLTDVTVEAAKFGDRSVTQYERHQFLTDGDEVVAELDHVIKRYERSQTRSRKTYMDRPLASYSAEDREAFDRHYAAEAALRRGGRTRYIEDLAIGDRLGPMLKGPLTLTNIVGFVLGAGSSFNPTNRMLRTFEKLHPGAMMIHPENGTLDTVEAAHWDEGFARASGMPAAYDLGIARTSWFSHLVTDWMGDDGFLLELGARMTRPNLLGDATWLTGKVAAVDLTSGVATLELTATNQLQETTATARADVQLPLRA